MEIFLDCRRIVLYNKSLFPCAAAIMNIGLYREHQSYRNKETIMTKTNYSLVAQQLSALIEGVPHDPPGSPCRR